MAPYVFFIHGLSGSGKSTIGKALCEVLKDQGTNVAYLDGDSFREGLSSDLSYSIESRLENIRRLMEVSLLLLNNNITVIASFIAPTEEMRQLMRNNVDNLVEIWCNCSIWTCIQRDPKGLYKKKIKNFTGICQQFDTPLNHHIELDTDKLDVVKCIQLIKSYVDEKIS